MIGRAHTIGAALVLALLPPAGAMAQDNGLTCIDCHNPQVSEPVHFMLGSVHWDETKDGTPVNEDGCASCHGPSDRHRNLPTQIQPDVSFGPKWTATIAEQNGACLACHAQMTRADWADGKHASENLTCVTCHDAHQPDRVRTAEGQAQVCTICHKVQKEGVHSFGDHEGQDPPCAECHDPHADPAPQTRLLASRSEGCRACHDLAAMATDPLVSETAKSYHKIMVSRDRTCIDCHRGVIHAAGHRGAVATPAALPSADVTLFYPGQTSVEWLTTRHPGAQPLRQGAAACRECHQGEMQHMGETLGASADAATRDVNVSLAQAAGRLELTVSWSGATSRTVSVMFGDDRNPVFAVGGCFAACHDDMAGMSKQRDLGHTKYLDSSRQQRRSIGRPAIVYDEATLARMRADGDAVELWQAKVVNGVLKALETFTVLEARDPDAEAPVTANARAAGDRTSVTFSRPLADGVKPIVSGEIYTIGVALHDPGMSGVAHWVSLPLTFSLDRDDTDFVAAQ